MAASALAAIISNKKAAALRLVQTTLESSQYQVPMLVLTSKSDHPNRANWCHPLLWGKK